MKKTILMALLALLILPVAYAQSTVELYDFYGQGCPHCAKLKIFLEDMKEKYPSLVVVEKEVYFNQENRELFQEMSDAYGTKIQGVPTVFIDKKVFVGFSDAIGTEIENEIKRCAEEGCASPLEVNESIQIIDDSSPTDDPGKTKLKDQITIGAVIGAAAVDAINPCAFAVLIILMAAILATKHKKRALFAGLAFSASVFISYYLMGVGLYSAIQVAGMTHWFYAVVAVLAIIVGLFNLKDYFWYGKWFVMEVPMTWRPKMKALLRSVTSVPGAFMIGFVVSLFLLPCTSGPYIVILGLLAKAAERGYALLLLLLYNFIFVLPMLIITFAIYFGFTTTEQAEEWRTKKLKVLHLIAGIIILLLGIGMLIALMLGYV
ncbi:cytochrome c biogenesis protein [Candidatus Woesearchaeota archaeon]|nr:cytochrome c biogenesis protein [Candidatus Woesearchaeota archaeon]